MNLGMGMCPHIAPRQEQRIELSYQQKYMLKLLLKLELKQLEPEFPEATRGLEGMLVADEMLKQRNSAGILIGGLAEEIWNRKATEGHLYRHKDVDVMVLDENFRCENFEGGIDWWLPHTETITLRSDIVRAVEVKRRYWSNGNNVALNFGVKRGESCFLSNGLYLPNHDFIVRMRTAERLPLVSLYEQVIDDEVVETFDDKIRKQLDFILPNFLVGKFYTLYEGVEIEEFDTATLVGINRLYGFAQTAECMDRADESESAPNSVKNVENCDLEILDRFVGSAHYVPSLNRIFVDELLGTLTEEDRSLVERYFFGSYDGGTYERIAKSQGKSPGMVGRRIRTALRQMRAYAN